MTDLVMPMNPFCTRRVQPGAIEYLDDALPPSDQFFRHRFQVIVGPHGCGKTTLLHHLVQSIDQDQRPDCFRVQSGGGFDAELFSSGLFDSGLFDAGLFDAIKIVRRGRAERIIVDGYDSLGWAGRLVLMVWIVATGRRFLGTSHRRLWGHGVVWKCRYDAAAARQLVDRLLQRSDASTRRLVNQHLAGEIESVGSQHYRDLLFNLYDIVQRHHAEPADAPERATCRD